MAVAFAVPDRGAREHLELTFTDEHIPFEEALLVGERADGATLDGVELVRHDEHDNDRRARRDHVDPG